MIMKRYIDKWMNGDRIPPSGYTVEKACNEWMCTYLAETVGHRESCARLEDPVHKDLRMPVQHQACPAKWSWGKITNKKKTKFQPNPQQKKNLIIIYTLQKIMVGTFEKLKTNSIVLSEEYMCAQWCASSSMWVLL